MDAPKPAPTAQPPTMSRPMQIALATVALVLVALVAYRGYAPGAARPTEHHAAVARQIDLNTAGKPELLQVPGVGPHLADAILTHRRDRGRFASVDELGQVKGIGGKTLDKIRPWVTVAEPSTDPDAPLEIERLQRKPVVKPSASVARGKLQPGDPPLDVNAADEAELQRLPGVGPTLARRIVEARGNGPFKSPDDLRRVKGIGPKTLDSLRPYITVR
jgi:competence protein ComEA